MIILCFFWGLDFCIIFRILKFFCVSLIHLISCLWVSSDDECRCYWHENPFLVHLVSLSLGINLWQNKVSVAMQNLLWNTPRNSPKGSEDWTLRPHFNVTSKIHHKLARWSSSIMAYALKNRDLMSKGVFFITQFYFCSQCFVLEFDVWKIRFRINVIVGFSKHFGIISLKCPIQPV